MENSSEVSKLLPCPAISIIIPVYNAEKFIGEALDSILEQTLQDFEVIVVDDCSKDSSPEVVKSYLEKFGGRLIFSSMKKNSGSAPAPRNKGFRFSRGEYIFFMDSDDTLTKTGLEEMYTLAKEYDADVVYCEKYFMSTGVGQDYIDNMRVAEDLVQSGGFVEKPTLITDDLGERLIELSQRRFWVTPWQRLVSRKLLVDYGIRFPEIIGCDDVIWCFQVLCCAERFLRVPNMCYVRRMYDESFTQSSKKSANKHIHQWMDRPIRGLKFADAFMDKLPFFKNNPYYRYLVYDWLSVPSFDMIFSACKSLKPDKIYDIFLKEFAKDTVGNSVLVSYLCTRICEQNKILRGFPQRPKPGSKFAPKAKWKIEHAENTCAISVVVSLYNYEKYIGECLESILNQTFQNFEVIVVDDCSIDNSVAVVESYKEKFGERLQLVQMEENSGGGGEPRNLGFSLASGEYVFFMDADDAFTKTALEEMYTLAKEYDAEVVYCEKYYMSSGVGEDFVNNIHLADDRIQKPPFVDEPTLETDNFVERTKKATTAHIWMTAWLRLVQRKLLVENNIWFDSLVASNDVNWTLKTLFCSKRFLHVPNACYIRRIHDESVSFRKRSPAEYVYKWMDIAIRALKDFDNFLNGIEFFQKNLKCRHDVINWILQAGLSNAIKECQKLPRAEVYGIFRTVFGKYLGKHDVLVAALFARIFDQGKWWDKRYKKLEEESKRYKTELEFANQRVAELEKMLSEGLRSSSASPFKVLAISVVIPMYNAQEYIAECLDSLLIQTFQDFEVIVVDDCSTDNSVAIVESYKEKFDGRLQITQTPKNLGSGGYIPRNLGLNFARGEYVIFVDADDFLLGTALETFYIAAKGDNADIVYTAAHYQLNEPNEVFVMKDGKGKQLLKDGLEDERALIVDEPKRALNMLIFDRGFTTPWTKFIRREFLIKNRIAFPEVAKAGDHIWTIDIYSHAKRILRIPTPLYFYRRYNSGSISMKKRPTKEQIAFWASAFIEWLTALRKLETESDILKENPAYCYEATRRDFEWLLKRLKEELKEATNEEVYEILYNEFKGNRDLLGLVIPFFFSAIDFKQRDLNNTKGKLRKANELVKAHEERLAELEGKSEGMIK